MVLGANCVDMAAALVQERRGVFCPWQCSGMAGDDGKDGVQEVPLVLATWQQMARRRVETEASRQERQERSLGPNMYQGPCWLLSDC